MINCKLLLLYIIEAFFMLQVGIGIFKLNVDKKRMLFTTVLYGTSIYSIRIIYEVLGIPLGTHSIILLILFSVYSIFICKISGINAISIFYIVYTIESISEWVITVPLIDKYNLIIDKCLFETWKGIGIGLTSYTFLIMITFIFWIKNRGLKGKKNSCKSE